MVMAGTHPDLTVVRTEQLSIGVDEVRSLVRKAAMSPSMGHWQILIIEDADRVTERGADALLKSIEEPAAKTVWMLCTPTADDVITTVRSRCRTVNLVTPSTSAVTALLEAEGVATEQAGFAARVCQGHIGYARALATDSQTRKKRAEILEIPGKLTSLKACLDTAVWAITTATKDAVAITGPLDAGERSKLQIALGMEGSKVPRGGAAAIKEMEEQQGLRTKRFTRDHLDSILSELSSFYRDVLMAQTNPGSEPVNLDFAGSISRIAASTSVQATLSRIDSIMECRRALATNVTPQLAFEALMVSLAQLD